MRAVIFFTACVPFAIFLMDCGGGPPDVPEANPGPPRAGTGSGGSGTGGSGTGGSVGQSGATTGGSAGTGTAGNVASGGAGTTGAGGQGGGAGAITAGTAPAGGTSSGAGMGAGGLITTAGTSAGGSGGGSTVTCEAMFIVTMDGFVRAPMAGGACWHGYAFAGGDATSTVTFPGGGTDFSKSMGTLKLSGTVGSATEENNYAGNVFFGVNLNQAASSSAKATVTPTGTSLAVTYSGGAGPMMRVQLQAPGGDSDATKRWCSPLTTSGTAIAYTSFMTECWDGGAQVAYAKQPIEAVLITIPGGAEDAAFDVTLTGIKEM
jgi:hypothetical protein